MIYDLDVEVEVTFRLSSDMPWMRVSMSHLKYLDVLNAIPFEGLTLRQILTESFYLDEEETTCANIIYDTFDKTWSVEHV